MSQYVEWLNKIKLLADYEWLTAAQRQVFNDIVERWQAETFVCLCGASGSGKSFVARLLAKEKGYSYVSELKEAPSEAQLIVVDGEDYTRLMRPMAQMMGLKRVVVLMRQPPQDPMPVAELVLEERDVKQFQHNLTKNGVLNSFRTNAEGTDLGQILRAEAIERGKVNAT